MKITFKIIEHRIEERARWLNFSGTPPTKLRVAVVESGGVRYGVSRWPAETEWAVDSSIGIALGVPYFVHGIGDRSCLKQAIAAEISEALNALDWGGSE